MLLVLRIKKKYLLAITKRSTIIEKIEPKSLSHIKNYIRKIIYPDLNMLRCFDAQIRQIVCRLPQNALI